MFARLAQDFDGLRLDLQRTRGVRRQRRGAGSVQGRAYLGHRRPPLDAQFVHVWDLREGQVMGSQQYTDTQQWNDVLSSG